METEPRVVLMEFAAAYEPTSIDCAAEIFPDEDRFAGGRRALLSRPGDFRRQTRISSVSVPGTPSSAVGGPKRSRRGRVRAAQGRPTGCRADDVAR